MNRASPLSILEWKRLISPILSSKKIKIASAVLASLLVFYSVLGYLVLPWYAKKALGNYVMEQLQRELVIEKIKFNPFTFHLRADNIVLEEKNQLAIASLKRLDINIDLDQVYKKTLVVSSLQLGEPHLDLNIDKSGSMNLSRLLQEFPDGSVEKDTDPVFNFIFVSTQINQGSVWVIDNSKEQPQQSIVKDINLEFSSISTLASEEGDYHVVLDLDRDTRINLTGSLSLTPFTSVGQFQIADLSAASINKWGKDVLPVELIRGNAVINGQYKLFSDDEGNVLFNINKTDLKISDIYVKDSLTQMLVSLTESSFNDISYASKDQTVKVKSISLSGLKAVTQELETLIDLNNLSLSQFEYDIEAAALTLAAAELNTVSFVPRKDTPALAELDRAMINDITFSEKTRQLDIGQIDLTDNHYLLETDATGRLVFPEINIASEQTTGSTRDEDTSSSALRIKLGELHLAQTSFSLFRPEQPEQHEPLLSLDKFVLIAMDADLAQSNIAIKSLMLVDAKANLALDKTGAVNALQLFATDSDTEEGNTVAEEKSFQFKLGKLSTRSFDLQVSDNSLDTGVQHRLRNIALEAVNITNDGQAHVDLKLNAAFNDRGSLLLTGWVVPVSSEMELGLELRDIDFAYLSPYLEKNTNVSMTSGALRFRGNVNNSAGNNGLTIKDAEVGLNNLQLQDRSTGTRLIDVNAMNIAGLGLTSSPLNINVKQIKLSGPYIKVHIDEQQNLNLLNVFKPANSDPVNSEQQEKNTESAFTLTLERIDMDQGNIDFADSSVTPEFSMRMHELAGTVSGVNSTPERYASIKLDGRVNEFGSVAMSGELQPFYFRKQSDINMAIKNISTNSLSPYAEKYAARKIESGSLSLSLNYKITNNILDGRNNIVLEKLVLGDEVSSPDAMDLSLDTAISLLEDDNGKIDINLPIKGDLNNPEFKFSAITQKAFGNLIGGIVTAPFKFIGSIFGVSGDELEFIQFVAGKTDIAPPEAEKLSILSEALLDRPALSLIVSGAYDPDRDAQALAKKALLESLVEVIGAEQVPLNYSDLKVQGAIADLADQRVDEATQLKLRESVTTDKTVDDTATSKAYFKSLFKQLTQVASADINEGELNALAIERAKAIVNFITGTESSLVDRVSYSDEVFIDNAEADLIKVTLNLDIE